MCAQTAGIRMRQLPRVNSRSMQMRMLKKRLSALEAITSYGTGCKCRFLQVTFFHSAADLGRIMSVPCPVHVFCDLGELSWAPSSMPLRSDDMHLCSCPASPTRDWLSGKRGPLTEQEQEEECRTWEQELREDPKERIGVRILLQRYKEAQRSRNEKM